MPFASALSVHPVATTAAGEVIGQVLDAVGPRPDLAILFVTAPVVGAFSDLCATVRTLVEPSMFLGVTASGVLCDGVGVEDQAAVVLWTARFDKPIASFGFHLRARGVDSVDGLGALVESLSTDQDTWLLVFADPYSFPIDSFFSQLCDIRPRTRVIGGLASAARGPGGNRLALGDLIVDSGALAVPIAFPSATVVAHGCRPIGTPWMVTRSERNVVYELGGQPALDRLMAVVDGLNPDDRILASRGLHCGIVVNEHQLDFARGDFLIRAVLGADKTNGAVALGAEVAVGSTVQFQVRDPATAGDDLAEQLLGRSADGVLVFTCTGRGSAMFGNPHHDAVIIDDVLQCAGPRRPSVAGMFSAGEFGPVGQRNALHGFTASLALFNDSP